MASESRVDELESKKESEKEGTESPKTPDLGQFDPNNWAGTPTSKPVQGETDEMDTPGTPSRLGKSGILSPTQQEEIETMQRLMASKSASRTPGGTTEASKEDEEGCDLSDQISRAQEALRSETERAERAIFKWQESERALKETAMNDWTLTLTLILTLIGFEGVV